MNNDRTNISNKKKFRVEKRTKKGIIVLQNNKDSPNKLE